MVKVYLYTCLVLFNASCFSDPVHGGITSNKKASDKNKIAVLTGGPEDALPHPYQRIVPISKSFVGIFEVGGNNMGFSNDHYEELMREVGWREGLSWCSFANLVTLDSAKIDRKGMTGWSPSSYNRKNVVFTDGEWKQEFREGDIFSLTYQKFKNDKTRFKGIGHTGVVEKLADGGRNVITLEGNTSEAGSRDGGGFHRKVRPLNSSMHITRWE